MQSKISLGTVQFGLDYGINNHQGKVSFLEAQKIIDFVNDSDLDTIDTASAYGDSEDVLGRMHKKLEGINIISKFSAEESTVEEEIKKSLKRLKRKSIYGYLAHSFHLMNDDIYEQLVKIQEKGYVEKIGISLYHPKEVDIIIKKYPKINLVQIPYSIFDQRFSSKLSILKQNKTIVHSRSTFLQGLVFMNPSELPKYLHAAIDHLKEFRNISKESKIPLNILAIYFVLKNKLIDNVVIGVTNKKELEDNIKGLINIKVDNNFFSKLRELEIQDENIILPYNWNKK